MGHSYNKGCMDYMKACDEAPFPPELRYDIKTIMGKVKVTTNALLCPEQLNFANPPVASFMTTNPASAMCVAPPDNMTPFPTYGSQGAATPTGSKASRKRNKPDSKDKFKRQAEMVNGSSVIKSSDPALTILLPHTWKILKRIGRDNPGHPWIIMGGFNAFLFSQDKQGGNPDRGPSPDFRHLLDSFNLFPLEPAVPLLTWNNNVAAPRNIQERLDWGITNNSWIVTSPPPGSRMKDKTPGPDGFNSNFYKATWSTVRNDVLYAASSFLNGNGDVAPLNTTLITLIPKVKQPTSISEYRPISLCNIVYKIISKIIANRLKLVLNSLISRNQSAFLPGRLISDNIIIAQEVAHSIKVKSRGKSGWMVVKLDMAKAFDRVEWPFIVAILRKFQFPPCFIRLIFACISTATFQFNLNGKVVGNVIPSRGICQGDPLSPYLFLLCAEGFSSLLHQQERNKTLVGFKVARRAPAISHLLFADDSFLFCQASISSCNTIKDVLEVYERATGQKGHLHNWKNKVFSKGGKETLLKSVIQAIPTYSMACFRLPVATCHSLESIMANFWWGVNENYRPKTHLQSWKKLCKSKRDGGLGFRSLVTPISPVPDKVESFITNSMTWDITTLNRCYPPHVVEQILAIPLPLSPSPDDQIWEFSKSGAYSVRSGYHLSLSSTSPQIFPLLPPSHLGGKTFGILIFLPRNKALKGQAQDQAHAILNLAHSYLAEFNSSLSASAPTSRPQHSIATTTWSPPASGLLKLNVDAAVSKIDGKAGFGGVIRNSEGLVVAALAQPYIGGGAVGTLEAKSLLSMLRWCIDEHFLVQEVETDCKAITDTLSHNKEDFTVFGDLICQIKEALSLIPNARLSHVTRGANYFADKLAHRALGLDEVAIWIGDDPCDLIEFLSL
uniref:Reverse transcriptase domain-containing protein n=1 Tax=Cannabis sativa TaxID=3483 RepID=A0A803PYY8_CANSA